MNEKTELTDEQRRRIEATLKRIRGGLKRITIEPTEEPAQLSTPEVYNAQ